MAKPDRTWELLQQMNAKLDVHGETLATLKAEAKFAKESVEDAEKIAKSAKAEIGKLKVTMARWGGVAAGVLGVVELLHRLVK